MAADVQLFAKKYARKAQKGCEPNDRKYSKKMKAVVKQMQPQDFDDLLRLDDE